MEVYCGSGSGWDAHNDLEGNHNKWCKVSDKPIAGLLTDLKARGLLEETLVVWGGEFGRTPFNEKGIGRDHNPWGFTTWMAGGGIRGGKVIGATDEKQFLMPINPKSLSLEEKNGIRTRPEHIHQALRELAGIEDHPFSKKYPLKLTNTEKLQGLFG